MLVLPQQPGLVISPPVPAAAAAAEAMDANSREVLMDSSKVLMKATKETKVGITFNISPLCRGDMVAAVAVATMAEVVSRGLIRAKVWMDSSRAPIVTKEVGTMSAMQNVL